MRYRHFKLDAILKPEHRPELVALASKPGTTVDGLHEWMRARNYELGRTAVFTWLRNFRSGLPARDSRAARFCFDGHEITVTPDANGIKIAVENRAQV
jgi:hypothetical protein